MELSEQQKEARVIVCSAIRHNQTGELICGARHHNCIHSPHRTYPSSEYVQGFIDQFNNFLTREEAWVIAEAKGQIVRRCGGDGKKLFSENLY